MTNHTDSAVTGPIATITQGPRQRSGVALAAAIVGSLLTTGGFFGAIITGLVESDAGVNISTVIFFVGVALALAAIALAVVTLVRGGRRVVPIVAIVIALLPALLIGALRLLLV
jgi:hypothetical protein